MFISAQTRALLLLTADLGGGTPLDGATFERLVGWLRKRGMQPADLLHPDAVPRLAGRPNGAVPTDQILSLLERGPALAAALERWQKAGLWVLGRGDPDYPRRLKRRLRTAAPALLFGCGDRALLNRGGIALVGGDGDAPEPTGFAARFSTQAAASGLTIISGGYSPIEAQAIRAGLSRGGGAIVVLPNQLLYEARSDRLRRPAADGLLVFVSATLPDIEVMAPAGQVAQQASAEDCLYGLADAALLVAVARLGLRWPGAVAASERGWVPLWVRRADPEAAELVKLGAGMLSDDAVSPRTLLDPATAVRRVGARPSPLQPLAAMPMAFMTAAPAPSLVGFAETPAPFGADRTPPDLPAAPAAAGAERGAHLRLVPSGSRSKQARSSAAADASAAQGAVAADPAGRSLYDIFVHRVAELLAAEELGIWRIADALELTEHQAETWLRRAEAAGHVSIDPLTRLYRYGSGR